MIGIPQKADLSLQQVWFFWILKKKLKIRWGKQKRVIFTIFKINAFTYSTFFLSGMGHLGRAQRARAWAPKI